MTFADAIKAGFKNYAQFRGVASRSEYWYWVLFTVLVGLVFSTIDSVMAGPSNGSEIANASGWLANISSLVFFLPNLSVGVRRMRDAGFSAWFLLVQLVPMIPFVVTISTLISEVAAFAGTSNPGEALVSFIGALAYVAVNPLSEESASFLAAFPGTFTWIGITLLVTLAVAIFFLVIYTRPTKTREQGNALVAAAPAAAPLEDSGTTA